MTTATTNAHTSHAGARSAKRKNKRKGGRGACVIKMENSQASLLLGQLCTLWGI